MNYQAYSVNGQHIATYVDFQAACEAAGTNGTVYAEVHKFRTDVYRRVEIAPDYFHWVVVGTEY
jgi:hypothetical protein